MIRKKSYTIYPVGADGSAAGTMQINYGRPGILRAISVTYVGTQPSTTDVVVKADTSSGSALFTATDNNTNIVGKALAQTGLNQTNSAGGTGTGVGSPFSKGIYISVAQANAGAAKYVTVELWIEV